ncbi:hypothetical protein SK128_019041, partial [Halocaridina rubra]
FHRNLPKSYESFKSSLHEMFPIIYDTKYLATNLKRLFQGDQANSPWRSTSLPDLASYLEREKGVLYVPAIHHSSDNIYNHQQLLHEAGYDAFLTGFIFLKLSHMFVMLQLPS